MVTNSNHFKTKPYVYHGTRGLVRKLNVIKKIKKKKVCRENLRMQDFKFFIYKHRNKVPLKKLEILDNYIYHIKFINDYHS